MKLPWVDNDTATIAWNAYKRTGEFDSSQLKLEFIGEDEDEELSYLELERIVDNLTTVQSKFRGKNIKSIGGQIDADIIETVHSCLEPLCSVNQLSRLGFWRWFSNIAYNGFFWKFIMWRFNSDKMINWGITSPSLFIEVYFYRAWIRGHKMYDKDEVDPYKYAKKGSSDVWRSHILRQDFGRDREFVKAFLDTIYDESGATVIGTSELRTKLIPALRAWTSNATFTHLSYSECLHLIQKLRTEGV